MKISDAIRMVTKDGVKFKRVNGKEVAIKDCPYPLGGQPLMKMPARLGKRLQPLPVEAKEPFERKERDPRFILDCIRGRVDAAWKGYKPLPCEEGCKDYVQCQELKRRIT